MLRYLLALGLEVHVCAKSMEQGNAGHSGLCWLCLQGGKDPGLLPHGDQLECPPLVARIYQNQPNPTGKRSCV